MLIYTRKTTNKKDRKMGKNAKKRPSIGSKKDLYGLLHKIYLIKKYSAFMPA